MKNRLLIYIVFLCALFVSQVSLARTWSTPTVLDISTEDASNPQVAINASGNTIIVWSEQDGDTEDLYSRLYSDESGLGAAPMLIAADVSVVNFLQVAMDDAGNAIAVWVGSERLYASHYSTITGWDAVPTRIDVFDASVMDVRLVMDANGNAFVGWYQLIDPSSSSLHINKYTAGAGWDVTPTWENNGHGISIDFDSDGNAVVVWTSYSSVQAMRYVAETGWETSAAVLSSLAGFNPKVATDGNGNSFAVWWQYTEEEPEPALYTSTYTAGTGWDASETLLRTVQDYVGDFVLDANTNGDAIVAWVEISEAGDGLYALHHNITEGWEATPTALALVGDGAGFPNWPDIVIDSNGNALASWSQNDSSASGIFVTDYTLASGWGSSPTAVDNTTNFTWSPSIAINPSGAAVIAWIQLSDAADGVEDICFSVFGEGTGSTTAGGGVDADSEDGADDEKTSATIGCSFSATGGSSFGLFPLTLLAGLFLRRKKLTRETTMKKSSLKKLATMFVLIMGCLLITQTAQARTCRVGATRIYRTIASALDLRFCSSVLVDAGTYHENLNIYRSVQIVGAGRSDTIIDGSAAGRVVTVSTSSTISIGFSQLTIQNGLVDGMGGGISAYDTNMVLTDVIVRNNTSNSLGGGIVFGDGSLTIHDSTFQKNTAAYGGALAADGEITIDGSRFIGNFASAHGGAIKGSTSHGGQNIIVNTTSFSDNEAGLEGGAIHTQTASDGSSRTLEISESLFVGNTAGNDGSAIHSESTFMFLENSTVSGNDILNNSAAIKQECVYDDSVAIINNSTITENSSSNGSYTSGISAYESSNRCQLTVDLSNTIIANNGFTNCSEYPDATIVSQGHNLASDDSCNLTAAGDLPNTEADLDDLANNGGTTRTHLPNRTSPVINAGNNDACAATDQRGVARPQGAACDIGAVEVEVVAP